MDFVIGVWLSGLVLSTSYLTHAYRLEFAFNIPYHLACITLATTGLVLVIASFVSSRFSSPPTPPSAAYIPLHDHDDELKPVLRGRAGSEPIGTAVGARAYMPGRRRVWSTFASFVVVVCIRLEMARRVITHTQCATMYFAPALPFMLALFQAAIDSDARPQPFHETKATSILQYMSYSRWRNIVPSLLLTLGAFVSSNSFPFLRSTYICSLASSFPAAIPRLQVAGTFLDMFILHLIDRIVSRGRDYRRLPPVQRLADPGWAALSAYMFMVLAGLSSLIPMNRYWYTRMPFLYIVSALKLGGVFALASLCALQTYRRIGLTATVVTTFFTAVNVASFKAAPAAQTSDLPIPSVRILFGLLLAFLGFLWFWGVETAGNSHFGSRSHSLTRVPRRMVLALAGLYLLHVGSWMAQPAKPPGVHPIPALMAKAQEQHASWQGQAAQSKTVAQAAQEYRKRYGRDPPPRFDKWFSFAMERNSLVIDDFDSMHEDLVPFWSLSPGDIRLRAFESISNPWNFIGGIQVRKGRTSLTPHVPDTHRWMLDGIQQMIDEFSHWLPDMDIAFNVNDEPRSAVYWHEMQGRLDIGHHPQQLPFRDDGDFHPDRSWIPVPGEPIEETRYRDSSFHNTFFTYGSVACHPSSRARVERRWDVRTSCVECRAEHSEGQFVANWSMAADPCHQPDLADSHGLHLSPSSFKGTNELMPVFSQSKAHGYHDILYPSPWNYVDKTAYRPSETEPDYDFADKESTLFWRGAATDGMSTGSGAWKGMLRQRLVHMVNNATDADRALVLLPSTYPSRRTAGPEAESQYSYHLVAPSEVRRHLSASFGVVNKIDRCAFVDCDVQELEFRPDTVPPMSFQTHWRYKFLMDVDGAGFSGRFLPFLQSNSLPFKASLSREWWDSRVVAWKHFVPVDIRLGELWSLLAWFGGWAEDEARGQWLVQPHEEAAQQIASDGRKWAAQVLRKEDMEIYLFRLLLEYGRLTDERRDELGWMDDRD